MLQEDSDMSIYYNTPKEEEIIDKTNKLWKQCIIEDKTKDVAWFVIKWCIKHKDLL